MMRTLWLMSDDESVPGHNNHLLQNRSCRDLKTINGLFIRNVLLFRLLPRGKTLPVLHSDRTLLQLLRLLQLHLVNSYLPTCWKCWGAVVRKVPPSTRFPRLQYGLDHSCMLFLHFSIAAKAWNIPDCSDGSRSLNLMKVDETAVLSLCRTTVVVPKPVPLHWQTNFKVQVQRLSPL